MASVFVKSPEVAETLLKQLGYVAEKETEPRKWLWEADQFIELGEAGFFGEKRVELIEGEVVFIAAQTRKHSGGVYKVQERLKAAFGAGYLVLGQATMKLNKHSAPDPDVTVVRGSLDDFLADEPEEILLCVEISKETLSFDRNKKASLYAKSGIKDYWILNLKANQLEVRREPRKMPDAKYSFGYSSVQILSKGDFVSPLALPIAQISVNDLLP